MSDTPDRSAPTSCPFCGSTRIVMTGLEKKAPQADHYWLCARCRELWHPRRLKRIEASPGARGRARARRGFDV
jgi:hypothetical protein